MSEFLSQQPQRCESINLGKEESVEVQYAVLGLITDQEGRLLLLNQRNKDRVIQSSRAWRTPGGHVLMPAHLRYPYNGQLRTTPIPKEDICDFGRLVHPDDVEDYLDLAERTMSVEYLMGECMRELVEEINEQIMKCRREHTPSEALSVEEQYKLISDADITIDTGSGWLFRNQGLKPGDRNACRRYFRVTLSDPAQAMVTKLVDYGRAIWFDNTDTNFKGIPVSLGGMRSYQVSQSEVFTGLSE